MPDQPWDEIPLSYLLSASEVALENAMLKRLELAAEKRKQIRALLDEWAKEEALALVFQWFIEHGSELMGLVTAPPSFAVTIPAEGENKPGPMRVTDLRKALKRLLDSA